MSRLQDRITVDPAICHGKPVIRGLRYPVEMILELLSSGMTADQIITDYEVWSMKTFWQQSNSLVIRTTAPPDTSSLLTHAINSPPAAARG
jgi:hypothetical protein